MNPPDSTCNYDKMSELSTVKSGKLTSPGTVDGYTVM